MEKNKEVEDNKTLEEAIEDINLEFVETTKSLESNFIKVTLKDGEECDFYNATEYLCVRMIGGFYSAYYDPMEPDEANTFAIQFYSKTIFNRTFSILKNDLILQGKDFIDKVKIKLKMMSVLENDDWEKIEHAIKYLERNGKCTIVDTLDKYVISELQGSNESRKNYAKVCQFVAVHKDKFASLKSNNYDKDLHYGVWLDKDCNIKENKGKVLLAFRSSVLYTDLFLKTKPVQDEDNCASYSAFKYSLKSLGILAWPNTKGKHEGLHLKTVAKGVTDWCLIIDIVGKSNKR